MKKPEINNLIAKVQGRLLTLKQCADATRELNKMILYVEELEQLNMHVVGVQSEQLVCKCNSGYWEGYQNCEIHNK